MIHILIEKNINNIAIQVSCTTIIVYFDNLIHFHEGTYEPLYFCDQYMMKFWI